jgi:hypothetical protein
MPVKTITLSVDLTDDEAWEMAQLMKRIGWSEWRDLSTSDDEADLMRTGCSKVQHALAEAGYSPR